MPDNSASRPDAIATEVRADGRSEANLNLARIGNCAVSALIDSRGRIVWCCMPRFDGDPVFHALLGASSPGTDDGRFSIELESLQRTEQSYDPGTAIVRTRLYDHSGQGIEITDFAPRFQDHGRTRGARTLAR
jgi:GH15 family glucan-1,4-alpha-glucosidase